MKYIDAELLKKEIERLKGICTAQIKANPGQTFPFVIEMTGYDKLLSFLDTLSEEPDKGLEEEIETWIPAHINIRTDETLPVNPTELANAYKEWGKCIARHFAEWQKSQKTRGTSVVLSSEDFQALIDSHTKRIEADYKEKMLKDAVEGEAEELYNDGESQCTVSVGTYFKPGDKVYVLKAEEE